MNIPCSLSWPYFRQFGNVPLAFENFILLFGGWDDRSRIIEVRYLTRSRKIDEVKILYHRKKENGKGKM